MASSSSTAPNTLNAPKEGRSRWFECAVCTCEKATKTALLRCPGCAFEVCKDCQKRFGEPVCMACRVPFTRVFLIEAMGKRWLATDLRRNEERRLLLREKMLLPAAMHNVEEIREQRRMQDQIRFGVRRHRQVQRERALAEAYIPCPAAGCRGFVKRGVCGLCRRRTCMKCLRLAGGESGDDDANQSSTESTMHVCHPDDLASVSLVVNDSRPCPRCGVFIHRAEGCSHMHCTHCGTHWDWNTGSTKGPTTNFHYRNMRAFARDVPVVPDESEERDNRDDVAQPPRDTREREGGACPRDDVAAAADAEHRDAITDAVDRSQLREALAETARRRHVDSNGLSEKTCAALANALCDDVDVVRFAVDRRYNESRLVEQHRAALARMRAAYIMGELNEDAWAKKLYIADTAAQRDVCVARILRLYLLTLRDFQAQAAEHAARGSRQHDDAADVRGGSYGLCAVEAQLRTLAKTCNEHLTSLRTEFGGPAIRIREDAVDADAPPLFIS